MIERIKFIEIIRNKNHYRCHNRTGYFSFHYIYNGWSRENEPNFIFYFSSDSLNPLS